MLKNNATSYGSVAKGLHWLIVVWILLAYLIILYLTGRTDARPPPGLNYHKVVGFTILIPVVLRICWRLFNSQPKLPESMPAWQKRLSGLSHFLLYFFLLAMPLSGYFGNGAGVDYGFFKIPAFRETAMVPWIFDNFGITYAQLNDFFDTFHYRVVGPYIFWVLIVVHASAAMYHHFIQKDDILIRMLPGKR